MNAWDRIGCEVAEILPLDILGRETESKNTGNENEWINLQAGIGRWPLKQERASTNWLFISRHASASKAFSISGARQRQNSA